MASTIRRSGTRFLTHNFSLENIISNSDTNSRSEWQLRKINAGADIKYDTKNCSFCAAPSLDFTCYYNYMTLLNQTYDYWSNYGLFDQGYKPLIYMPSFWGSKEVPDMLMQMATISGVNLERGPNISLMGVRKGAGYSDYWIYKAELVKLINYAENQFYQRFKVDPKGRFDFGTREEDMVRPTQLIRVYANLEQALRKENI
jgi:hypothetical protein